MTSILEKYKTKNADGSPVLSKGSVLEKYKKKPEREKPQETFQEALSSAQTSEFEKGLQSVLEGGIEGIENFGNFFAQFVGSQGKLEDTGDIFNPQYTPPPQPFDFSQKFTRPQEELSDPERYGRTAARFTAGAAPAPGAGLKSALAAPIVGLGHEGYKDLGIPEEYLPYLDTITAILAHGSPEKGQPRASKVPEIRQAENLLKKRNISTENQTVARNALKERTATEGAAQLYKSTARRIENASKAIEADTNKIIAESIPGFEGGIENVEKIASSRFEPVKEQGKQVIITRPDKFVNSTNNIIADVKNTLANSPDELGFIEMLEKARDAAVEGRTGEPYINFYQTLNRVGRWVDPSKKERYMAQSKNSIKDTFRDNGRPGQQLANNFDKANSGYVKYIKADKMNSLLEKTIVDDKINFSKLKNSLDNKKNYETYRAAVGDKAAKNLKIMANIGKQISRMEEAIKGGVGKQGILAAKGFGLASSILTLEPATIASAIGGAAALETGSYIASQMLTNPTYQNLWIRLGKATRDGNKILATSLAEEIKRKAENEM